MRTLLRFLAVLSIAALSNTVVPGGAGAWPHSPLEGVVVTQLLGTNRIVPDAAGGSIVFFQSGSIGDYNVSAQRYDATGKPLWGPSGVVLCNVADAQYVQAAVSDGSGGAIVAWDDYRLGSTNPDIFMQRVSASGVPAWTANGVRVCDGGSYQWSLSLAGDGGGNSFLAWEDRRSSGSTGTDIYVQYVNSSGALSHGTGGQAVCTLSGDQNQPNVCFDSSGYPVVVWTDARTGSADIYVQRLAPGGAIQYATFGVVVCSAAGTQNSPLVIPGGYTNLLVGWSDFRGGTGDIYAQRLDANTGAGQLTANGIAVCAASGSQFLRTLVHDGQGGYVFAWEDSRTTNAAAYAQKLNLAGTSQWTVDGVAVRNASGNATSIRSVADGLGGTLHTWQDTRSGAHDVYVQRLGSNGLSLWTSNGVPVVTADGGQTEPDLCATPTGGAVCAYKDFRAGPAFTNRIQGIDEWGYLGAEPLMAGAGDVPNDQGGKVRVAWYASPLDIDPLFRNISSYLIFRSVSAPLATTLDRVAPLRAGQPFTTLNGRRFVRLASNSANYFWEEVGSVTARHLSGYSFIAPTEGDSIAGSNPRTSFMVMALANYGSSWWVSASDSAYSVDNLAPVAPAPFTGQYGGGSVALHWNPNTEADLAGYRLYRGTSPGFATGPGSLVAALPDTGYTDVAGHPYFYKLTAIDIHGNESPVAFLQPQGTLDAGSAGGALTAYFAAPRPNPARAGVASALRFAIPRAGHVRLALHDAQGRTVRVLLEGPREAGEHAVAFDGRAADGRRLAPGLYLARIEAPGLAASQRVVVVE